MKNFKEVKTKDYRPFDMEGMVGVLIRSFKMQFTKLKYSIDRNRFMKFSLDFGEFHGDIIIGLSQSDLFNVFFISRSGEILQEIRDVRINNLIYVIDQEIEVPGL